MIPRILKWFRPRYVQPIIVMSQPPHVFDMPGYGNAKQFVRIMDTCVNWQDHDRRRTELTTLHEERTTALAAASTLEARLERDVNYLAGVLGQIEPKDGGR